MLKSFAEGGSIQELKIEIARNGNPAPISINDCKYPHSPNFSFRISKTTCATRYAMDSPLIIDDCVKAVPASCVIPKHWSSFPSQYKKIYT